jgi:hypothetical protein
VGWIPGRVSCGIDCSHSPPHAGVCRRGVVSLQLGDRSRASGYDLGMLTKRQPTLRTLLLQTLICAAQLAAFSTTHPFENVARSLGDSIGLASLAITGLLPLVFPLWIRSALRVVLACVLVGVIIVSGAWCDSRCFFVDPENTAVDWNVLLSIGSIFTAPLASENYAIKWLYPDGGYSVVSSAVLVCLDTAWIILYAITGFLIAKSCRLREPPATDGAPAP